MKFLILHDNGIWVHDIMVSELQVVALGLDGQELVVKRVENIPRYQHCSTLQSGLYIMVPTLQRGINAAGCSVGPERTS